MKTLVASVLHPQSSPYWEDFFESVAAQTDLEFELLLVRDSVPQPSVNFSVPVRHLNATGKTISQVRKALLQECISLGAEIVILADSDDKMHESRVEKSKKAILEGASIFFNELVFFPKAQPQAAWLGRRCGAFVGYEDLKEGNCLGFSNSAFLLEKMPASVFNIDDQIKVFDWAFYSRFLYSGQRAQFLSEGLTWYRVHDENMALFKLEKTKIESAIFIKMQHYKDLIGLIPWAKEKYDDYEKLQKWLQRDPENWKPYIKKLNSLDQTKYMWWEAVHP